MTDKTVDDLEGMLDNKQKEELKKKYIEEFKKMDRANKRKKGSSGGGSSTSNNQIGDPFKPIRSLGRV